MSLVGLVIVLLVVGLLLWAVQSLPFIDGTVKTVIKIVVIVVVALWLLQAVGLLGSGPVVRFR